MGTQRALIGANSLVLIASVACSTGTQNAGSLFGAPRAADELAVFAPRPDGRNVTIKYDCTDEVLGAIVVNVGPSLRQWTSSPRPATGTRIVGQDTSAMRLEGNKVRFDKMLDEHRAAIESCLEGLIGVSEQVDIPGLPRDEQLAYWLNLHNLIVINELAKNYPVLRPRDLELGPGLLLHSAPLVEVSGVRLSLSDIRKGIVFRYWKDPRVLYGFFTGELASPNIRTSAWEAAALSDDLDANAREFVNSLRGVREGRAGALSVSPIYADAREWLFPEWPEDLRAHLYAFAGKEVRAVLANTQAVVTSGYEGRTADLVAGYVHIPTSPVVGYAPNTSSLTLNRGHGHIVFRGHEDPEEGVAQDAVRAKWLEIQHRQRERRKTVIIEDEPLEDRPVKARPKPIE